MTDVENQTMTEVSESDEDDDLGSVLEDESKRMVAPPVARLPPVDAEEGAKILDQIRYHSRKLQDISTGYSQREAAIRQIMACFQGKRIATIPGWWEEMKSLQKCIGKQLEDLRSKLINASCELVVSLSEHLGHCPEWADTLAYLLPILFNRLYVTIHVRIVVVAACVSVCCDAIDHCLCCGVGYFIDMQCLYPQDTFILPLLCTSGCTRAVVRRSE